MTKERNLPREVSEAVRARLMSAVDTLIELKLEHPSQPFPMPAVTSRDDLAHHLGAVSIWAHEAMRSRPPQLDKACRKRLEKALDALDVVFAYQLRLAALERGEMMAEVFADLVIIGARLGALGGPRDCLRKAKRPGRPKGTGYERADAPFVEQARARLAAGVPLSKVLAEVSPGMPGASPKAKADRLRERLEKIGVN